MGTLLSKERDPELLPLARVQPPEELCPPWFAIRERALVHADLVLRSTDLKALPSIETEVEKRIEEEKEEEGAVDPCERRDRLHYARPPTFSSRFGAFIEWWTVFKAWLQSEGFLHNEYDDNLDWFMPEAAVLFATGAVAQRPDQPYVHHCDAWLILVYAMKLEAQPSGPASVDTLMDWALAPLDKSSLSQLHHTLRCAQVRKKVTEDEFAALMRHLTRANHRIDPHHVLL
jgi:hypothetical protein